MRDIFFYGLFMDESRLRAAGFGPVVIGPAVLDGYALAIESRATLEAESGSRSYGVVMTLPAAEAQSLYSEPSVADYEPEEVTVTLLETESPHECWCYNLPKSRQATPPNESYRGELSRLLTDLGFPSEYVRKVLGSSPAASQAVAADQQQPSPIDPRCHLASYFDLWIGSGQRCCWPLNAGPLGRLE